MPAGPRLADALSEAARRHPDARALSFLDARLRPRHYTYRSLFERSAGLAAALAARMRVPRAPIGILLASQEAQVLHYLAALEAGCVPAILTPPNRKLNLDHYLDNLRAMLATCRFSALITDLETLDAPTTVLEPFSLRESRRGPDADPCSEPDAAVLQFSSGTTGIKRGVLITNRAALAQLQAYRAAIALSRDDCIVSWLPLYHDMGFMACLNMPLACGVHCVMLEPLDWVANPISYLRAAAGFGATLGWNPNFAYAFMADRASPADLEGLDLGALRGLVNCSEPVTWESQRRFLDRFAAAGLRRDVFVGCYAMAETTFALTHGRADEPGALDHDGPGGSPGTAGPLVSTGRPLPGVEIKIADDRGAAVPERGLGEILVRSPFAFAGYYNNQAATAAAFRDGWYRTGDVGYRIGEQLFVCGRSKDVLIVGGVNVFPQDLEDLVSGVAGIRPGRVVAFAVFDPRLQTEKVIILAEPESAPDDAAGLVLRARQRVLGALQIANFEIHLVPAQWLIKSSSGKMSRSANRLRWTASA